MKSFSTFLNPKCRCSLDPYPRNGRMRFQLLENRVFHRDAWIAGSILIALFLCMGFEFHAVAAPPQERPQLVSKELFIRHEKGRPPVTGFVTYIDPVNPVLMHCFGREDYSDGYDDYAVQISTDNGRTWSPPEVRWRSTSVPEGRMRYAEPAAFFDAKRERLLVLIDHVLYPKDKLNVDTEYNLELHVFDTRSRQWIEKRKLEFPGERTPAMSFTFPIQTRPGRILFPGMRKRLGSDGKAIHFKGVWAPVDESVTVIGEWASDESAPGFRLGQALQIEPERSSRGLDENTLFELNDGRIVAVCRGDNSGFPDKPGHKWVSFSNDSARTWSTPVPLTWADGGLLESGANGSALFRSVKNGRLYWMGNLALRGERANGNWPRSPLCLVEVSEEPFALKRETVFAVDERNFNDSPKVQMSNFRYYQDRATGELVVFLTRYGEVGEKEWMLANYYRYRIELPVSKPAVP